jgi:hypothetical protein
VPTLDQPRPAPTPPAYVTLYDLSGDIIARLVELDDLEAEDRLGGIGELRFTLRADDPLLELVLPDALVEWSGRLYRIRELDQQHKGATALVDVYADARWLDLARKRKFGNFPILATLPQAGLVEILKNTGWTAGVDPDPGGVTLYSVEGYDDTVLAHLRRWADVTGYELAFDDTAKTVTLVEAIGQDRGVGFRYGSNLAGFRRRYEPPTATVLYPVGANDLTIDSVNPSGELYVENFDWYVAQGLTLGEARTLHTKEDIWLDNRYLLPLNLYDAAIRRLAELSQPRISYECTVVDLADAAGSGQTPIDIGDIVRVYDATFSVDIATRVVRRVSRPLTPGGDEVELAYLRPTSIVSDGEASRSPDYGRLSILVDQCDAISIGSGASDYAVIALNTTGSASTLVTGGTFVGTASGAGTIRWSHIIDGIGVGTDYETTFADGELVEFSAPSYIADVAEGSHTLSWRAQVIAGAGTVALDAGGARGWLLTSGAYGLGVNTSPNRRVVEEMLELPALGALVDTTMLVELNGSTYLSIVPNRDLVEADTVTTIVGELGAVTELYILPFIIGDPEFGKLDGPGALS